MKGYRSPHTTPIVAVIFAIVLSPPGPIEGYATHYALGLFEKVRLNRGLPAADCHIASDWHPLGSFVAIEGQRTGVRRIAQVSDVSAPKDRARHMRDGLVELSYRCAQDVCGVAFAGPWRWCPVRVQVVQERHNSAGGAGRTAYRVRGMRQD